MDSTYNIKIIENDSKVDNDVFLFRLFKTADASDWIDDEGKSSGSEGHWDDMVQVMLEYSKKHPGVFWLVDEHWSYEDSGDIRHYFRNGQYKEIAPILTWPEFGDVEWQDI